MIPGFDVAIVMDFVSRVAELWRFWRWRVLRSGNVSLAPLGDCRNELKKVEKKKQSWWSRWDCFWLFEENPRKTTKSRNLLSLTDSCIVPR
jgi:hypothetical protein